MSDGAQSLGRMPASLDPRQSFVARGTPQRYWSCGVLSTTFLPYMARCTLKHIHAWQAASQYVCSVLSLPPSAGYLVIYTAFARSDSAARTYDSHLWRELPWRCACCRVRGVPPRHDGTEVGQLDVV